MRNKLLIAATALALGSLLAVTAYFLWLGIRSQPSPTNRDLFEGVHYTREVRNSPRPMVIHVVTIDLRASGIELLVTPGDPEADLSSKARTTSHFLKEFGVQIAVNGDGFEPWRSNTLLDYYPHRGDPVEPVGFAASRGSVYSDQTDAEPVLYISRANQARFNTPTGRVYNAISGNLMLVEQGQALPTPEDNPQPRTAIALDKQARRLIIVVVDGRQPRYSQGATLAELAEILLAYGGHVGMNMDGGGSSTLVMRDALGRAVALNSPINHGIRSRQRPVANHLGIFASPISD